MNCRALEWAAGFILGEGWFGCSGSSFQVRVSQVERAPLEELARLFGGNIYRAKVHVLSRTTGLPLAPQHAWCVTGPRAVGVAMTMYPLMWRSPKRQAQIRAALSRWRSRATATGLRSHCPAGHAYTSDNTYTKRRGGRICKACLSAANDPQRTRRAKWKLARVLLEAV